MEKDAINLGDYKGSEIMKGFTNQPLTVEERLQDNLTKGLIDEETFDKANIVLDLLKAGKKAVIGEIRTRGNGNKYKKTAEGWVKVKIEKKESSKDISSEAKKEDFQERVKRTRAAYEEHKASGDTEKMNQAAKALDKLKEEDRSNDKSNTHSTIKLKSDVGLASLSALKGKDLKVVDTKNVKFASGDVKHYVVEDEDGEKHEISEEYIDNKEDKK